MFWFLLVYFGLGWVGSLLMLLYNGEGMCHFRKRDIFVLFVLCPLIGPLWFIVMFFMFLTIWLE